MKIYYFDVQENAVRDETSNYISDTEEQMGTTSKNDEQEMSN